MEPWRPLLESPDDWAAHPGWRWPWWKFDMQPSDLFGTLALRYNQTSLALQDFEAFHHDVSEMAAQATDTQDFHRLMAARQRQRLDELISTLNHVANRATANPNVFPHNTHNTNTTTKTSSSTSWARGVAFFRNRSLDAIVTYFAGLIADQDNTPAITEAAPSPAAPNKDIDKKRESTTSLADIPLTPPALDDEPDISVVSTLDDSFSTASDSQPNTTAALDDHQDTLHPTTIMNHLSPFRASPSTRRFVRSELTVFSEAHVSPIKLPIQSPQKPVAKRRSIVKKPQPSTATGQRAASDRLSTSSTSTSRYNLRSQREQPASIFTKDDLSQTSQNKRTRQEGTSTRQKRQRVS